MKHFSFLGREVERPINQYIVNRRIHTILVPILCKTFGEICFSLNIDNNLPFLTTSKNLLLLLSSSTHYTSLRYCQLHPDTNITFEFSLNQFPIYHKVKSKRKTQWGVPEGFHHQKGHKSLFPRRTSSVQVDEEWFIEVEG